MKSLFLNIIFVMSLFAVAGFAIDAEQQAADTVFSKAEEAASSDLSNDPRIVFNQGVDLFKKADYSNARSAFEKALSLLTGSKHGDKSLEARARTAEGNCLFRMASAEDCQLDDACKLCLEAERCYQDALKIKANYKPAAANLAAAGMLLKKLYGIKYLQMLYQKKMQEIMKKLAELAERQQKAADNTVAKQNENNVDVSELVEEQQPITDETATLLNDLKELEKIFKQQDGADNPMINCVGQALDAQQKSVDNFDDNQIKEAGENQQLAADKLKEALQQSKDQQNQNQNQKQDNNQDKSKNQDESKEQNQDESKEQNQDESKEQNQDESKEQNQDESKEQNQDESKEQNQDESKDQNQDESKDQNQDESKDQNQDESKDQNQDESKDQNQDESKEQKPAQEQPEAQDKDEDKKDEEQMDREAFEIIDKEKQDNKKRRIKARRGNIAVPMDW